MRNYTHKIAIVNNADLNNPEHFLPASVRPTRAIKKARSLKGKYPDAVLFRVDAEGNRRPISLKRPAQVDWSKTGYGLNSHMVGGYGYEHGTSVVQAARQLDRIAKESF